MNHGRTKEPRKNPEPQKVLFIKIDVSFISLIPCQSSPRDDREMTERRVRKLLHDFSNLLYNSKKCSTFAGAKLSKRYAGILAYCVLFTSNCRSSSLPISAKRWLRWKTTSKNGKHIIRIETMKLPFGRETLKQFNLLSL